MARDAAGVAVVDAGRNSWVVEEALRERRDCTLADDEAGADVCVIGTLSPGPMLDAWERRRVPCRPVVRPWSPLHVVVDAHAGARW